MQLPKGAAAAANAGAAADARAAANARARVRHVPLAGAVLRVAKGLFVRARAMPERSDAFMRRRRAVQHDGGRRAAAVRVHDVPLLV